MNPKPFASLNHFTVPVAMSFPFLKLQLVRETVRAPAAGTIIKGRNGLPLEDRLAAIGGTYVRLLQILRRSCEPGSEEPGSANYSGLTFVAAGPFCPCVTSKETFWPSFSDL